MRKYYKACKVTCDICGESEYLDNETETTKELDEHIAKYFTLSGGKDICEACQEKQLRIDISPSVESEILAYIHKYCGDDETHNIFRGYDWTEEPVRADIHSDLVEKEGYSFLIRHISPMRSSDRYSIMWRYVNTGGGDGGRKPKPVSCIKTIIQQDSLQEGHRKNTLSKLNPEDGIFVKFIPDDHENMTAGKWYAARPIRIAGEAGYRVLDDAWEYRELFADKFEGIEKESVDE